MTSTPITSLVFPNSKPSELCDASKREQQQSNQQPSRCGFGRARGQRNFSNSSNTSRRPPGQQQQQQQQVAAPAAKPKPTPGSREVGSSQPEMTRVLMILTHVFSLQEAEAHMALWEARE
ncbi:hypothetical protein FCIRC_3936 [Fusarium circinatum]|uniref:Uncharacterized protein n=1 Tax=Fusarium circinatum TaxID=48490 RepID=A0A8H5UE85_FUSCI|nr:hypothetical protein FCIRC_3936 [Fusarium circinatum]